MPLSNFSNEKRNRYYGIRVGDLVRCKYTPNPDTVYEVVALCFMDNNGVFIQEDGKEPVKAVAEYCEIVEKIEDRDLEMS